MFLADWIGDNRRRTRQAAVGDGRLNWARMAPVARSEWYSELHSVGPVCSKPVRFGIAAIE